MKGSRTYLLANPPSAEEEGMHDAGLSAEIGGASVNSRSQKDEGLAHLHLSVDAICGVYLMFITPQMRTRDNLNTVSLQALDNRSLVPW